MCLFFDGCSPQNVNQRIINNVEGVWQIDKIVYYSPFTKSDSIVNNVGTMRFDNCDLANNTNGCNGQYTISKSNYTVNFAYLALKEGGDNQISIGSKQSPYDSLRILPSNYAVVKNTKTAIELKHTTLGRSIFLSK